MSQSPQHMFKILQKKNKPNTMGTKLTPTNKQYAKTDKHISKKCRKLQNQLTCKNNLHTK